MNSEFIVAVHAMVYLHHRNRTVSSDILAENICTNAARVRRVMARLKKAGLVRTREGRTSGGYSCIPDRTVTLGEISRALEVKFADTSWHSGNVQMECEVASGMAGYMNGLYDELNQLCGDYLDRITLEDVERKLFEKSL